MSFRRGASLCWLVLTLLPGPLRAETDGPGAQGGWPLPFPEQFSAVYDGFVDGVVLAESRIELEALGGGRYRYWSRRSARGLGTWLSDETVFERSLWSLEGDRLRPLRFEYDRSGGGQARRVELEFDWRAGRVTNIIGSERWRMGLDEDTLDKLTYRLALMRDLAARQGGEQAAVCGPGDADLCYSVADGGRLKRWRFRLAGEDVLTLPVGSVHTIRVRRIRRDSSPPRSTELWCAPEFGYLPVRIDYQAKPDGRSLSLRLRELRLGPEPP